MATNTPDTPIPAGDAPVGVAITPDGTTAYVVNNGDNTVTPITLAAIDPPEPEPEPEPEPGPAPAPAAGPVAARPTFTG